MTRMWGCMIVLFCLTGTVQPGSLAEKLAQKTIGDQSVNSTTDDDASVFGFLFSALEQGSRIRDRLEEPDGVYPADRGADHLHRVENDGPPDVQVQQHRELKGNPVGIRMPGHRMPKHIEPYSN